MTNETKYSIQSNSGLSKFRGRHTIGKILLELFKGYLPQNLLSPLLHTFFQIFNSFLWKMSIGNNSSMGLEDMINFVELWAIS